MDYLLTREFDRFEERLNERLTRIEDAQNRTESKVDILCGQAKANSRVIAKKAAVHVSWIAPLMVALLEAIKAAFR